MKRVNNSDINFLLNPKTVNLSNFNVRFYTVNSEHFFVRKSQVDVKTVEVETEEGDTSVNYYLKLDWSELVTLGEGVLQYQLLNNYQDSDRADNYYNQNIERTTQYYIDSNITVDEDEAESYAEIIAELGDKIDSEITRSTSADTLQTEALNSEIQIRQDQINEILDIIDSISGETDLSNYYKKSETSGATEISNALGSKVNSQTFINHTADTNVHVTSADKEKWDAKVDKSWIEEKLGSSFTGVNSANTVTSVIEENEEIVTAALTDLNKRKLDASAYTPTDLTNYYTKSETNDLLDNKLDASAYTPTDLTNYYTKSEVYNKSEIDNKGYITDISGKLNISDFNAYSANTKTLIDGKQNELVSGENIKTINNQSLLGSGNITIEGGSGGGGFITVTNPSADTKVGLVNSLSQYYDTNIGKCAVIEGDGNTNNPIIASGAYTHSEGFSTTASGDYSHAEGNFTKASGIYSHAEGYYSQASGYDSHAEGSYTSASTECSHAEGQGTLASGNNSHAEGFLTKASGNYSHAEGQYTVANNNSEHASGQYNISNKASTTFGYSGNTLFSVGNGTYQKRHNAFEIRQNGDIYITSGSTDIKLQDHLGSDGGSSGFISVTNPSADTKVGLVNSLSQYYDTNIGKGAVIEGDGYEYSGTTYNIVASGDYSHAEGKGTVASGDYSHAEGSYTNANGNYSHAEGYYTSASTDYSHAEGSYTNAIGYYSHAEGSSSRAIGYYSHAEGDSSSAIGNNSHAEGSVTNAIGNNSHAEGTYTKASGSTSHAEGNDTLAIGNTSHAEGQSTRAVGDYGSHAEGQTTVASGWCAHAEGQSTQALGNYSHAEGQSTVAIGQYCAHAEGQYTIAINNSEHASGQYNVSSSASTTFGDSGNTLFSVGNGTSQTRHNAFEIRQNGDIYISSGGTNTSPMVKLQDNLGGNVDLSNYYTKTEVDEIVDDVVAGQIDLSTYAKIDWVQTNYALKTDVPKIWIGTQSEYDNITNKNENTVYIIK